MFNDFQADSGIKGYSRSPRGYSTNDYIHVNMCGNLNLDEDSDVLRPLGREDYLLIYKRKMPRKDRRQNCNGAKGRACGLQA